jgi:glycerophosphoryl diester phosphodiesterase
VIDVARAEGVPMLGLRSNMIDAAVVAEVRRAGLGIGGWACNDAPAIAKIFGLAVDVFTTDRPDLALAMRGQGSR